MSLKRVPIIGTGTDADPFRPDVADPVWWCSEYDLKEGVCLVATDPDSASMGNVDPKGLRAGVTPEKSAAGAEVEIVVDQADADETIEGEFEGTGTAFTFKVDAKGAGRHRERIPVAESKGFPRITLTGKTSGKSADLYVGVI